MNRLSYPPALFLALVACGQTSSGVTSQSQTTKRSSSVGHASGGSSGRSSSEASRQATGGSSGGGSGSTATSSSGSGSSVPASGSSSGGSGTSRTCAFAGESCTGNIDCCGGYCASMVCADDDGGFDTTETLCPQISIAPLAASCDGGVSFSSQLVDVFSCTAIAGAAIEALDANGVPFPGVAATTLGNGAFAICPPADSPFTVQMVAAGYPTSYFAELTSGSLGYLAQVGLLSTGELGAVGGTFPGGLQSGTATVVARVAGSGVCNGELAGWSLEVSLPDGGAEPDGGCQIVYLGSSYLPANGATATQKGGYGVVYDIDPTASNFLTLGATNPDAGVCPVENAAKGLTGRVFVAPNSLTLDLIPLP